MTRKLQMALLLNCGMLLLSVAAFRSSAWSDEPKGGAHTEVVPVANDGLTPEQRMNRRFPQPVRVGDLIGLPVQDFDDRILGTVTEITRNGEGKIGLIVSHCAWLGWDCRTVRVPLETVVILARHLNLMDIPREAFLALPSWTDAGDARLSADDTIRIGLGRR
jgi:hypothetical protein